MKLNLLTLLPLALLLLCSATLHAQSPGSKTLFYIDSLPVTEDLDADDNTLLSSDIAVYRKITSKDTIAQLGIKDMDTVVFILTRAYQQRPDSLKRIPSLKKLLLKNERFYLDTTQAPYDGPFVEYYLNGTKKTFGNMVKGQIEGYANIYYPDGSLMESHYYQHNKEDGMREEYYPNGVIRRRGRFKEGFMEGYWQEWYSTGKLKREVYYLHSTPHFPDEENAFYDALNEAANDIRQQQYRPALQLLGDLKKAAPGYQEIYYYTGDALLQQKKYEKAIEAFNQALELEPLDAASHIKRAQANIALLEEAARKNKTLADAAARRQTICTDLQAARAAGIKDRSIRSLQQQYCS